MLFTDTRLLALVGLVLTAILLKKYLLAPEDPALKFPVVGEAKGLDIRKALEEGQRRVGSFFLFF